MEGLKPSVRLAVGIQQPNDLDTAYQLAILHEELGSSSVSSYSSAQFQRRSTAFPLPAPPAVSSVSQSVHRVTEEKRPADTVKHHVSDDKWGALRAYRRAKGLCFVCGEKWGKDHLCKQEVQLHVVQEMVEFLQGADLSETDDQQSEVHMLSISAAALGERTDSSVKTMQLKVQLQGLNLTFLVDSGSTHSFLDKSLAPKLQDLTPI